MRFLAVLGLATGLCAWAGDVGAQTFSRVEFYPEMRLDYILAVADFNDDGRDDPGFNDGHTAAQALAHFDINSDGFEDLLLMHERDGPPEVLSFTGRYIQVLINDDGEAFVDETSTWMSDQNLTTPERFPNGDGLHNSSPARPRMLDIDRDGCKDIVVANGVVPIRSESPIFYLNNGSGQFQPLDPDETFTGMNWDGRYQAPADVNGDGVIDLVFPQRVVGPDDEYGTDDDSTRFLTLLNTTPVASIRCNPRVMAVGTLPARTLHVGAEAMVVAVADAFQDARGYQASSSAPGVATVSVAGSDVTVAPVAVGVTTITVTASGADNSIATQQFQVTVLAAASVQ